MRTPIGPTCALTAFLFFCAGCSCSRDQHSVEEAGVQAAGDVVVRFNSLDSEEKTAFIRLLGKNKDIKALQSIVASDSNGDSGAAIELVKVSTTSEALAFCRSLKPGSAIWIQGFQALCFHPCDDVFQYAREMVARPEPLVKYSCYRMCMLARSDVLLEYAYSDESNDAILGLINGADEERTLGQYVRKYIARFAAPVVQKNLD